MSRKAFVVALSVIMTVILGMIITAVRFRPEPAWDVCYEMVNSRIEWTGAGYNGIYD